MKIIVSEEVAAWYKKELEIAEPTYVRFYVRYGGFGGNIPGFSVGMTLEAPTNIHTATTIDDITFYIEEADAWYFEGKDLYVTFSKELQEPIFKYR